MKTLQKSLTNQFSENLQTMQQIYNDCSDVIFHTFAIENGKQAAVVYIDNLTNTQLLSEHVMIPLMNKLTGSGHRPRPISDQTFPVSQTTTLNTYGECVQHISAGNPILLCEGLSQAIAFGLAQDEARSVEEPPAEAVIRGPREGFNEKLGVNLSLIRRRIRSPQLKIIKLPLGTYSQTEIAYAYVEGIADSTLIEELKARLSRIKLDAILESLYIEELIEDNPSSPFPQILNTERPDIVVSSLMEGRAAVLVNGTPFALVVPAEFITFLQSPEDYYQRFWYSSAVRWLRYIATVAALLLPSFYVALLTFHQEMVPTSLFLSVAQSREDIPFPAVIEAMIMEVSFEMLREAGVRLPKQIGSAVSIVGALVIGQAAVQAGIVSAPMVIIVATTGITSFAIPHYSLGFALRLLRFPFMVLAGMLGLLGIILGIIAMVVHMCSLRSFGVPYLSPIGPTKPKELKDVNYRAPWWKMNTRPHLTGKYNKYRQPSGEKPDPAKNKR